MLDSIRFLAVAGLSMAAAVGPLASPLAAAMEQAQSTEGSEAGVPTDVHAPVFIYRDGRMALLVQDLQGTSPTAARMLRTLRNSGVRVIFGTIDRVMEDVRTEHRHYDPVRQKVLGFMAPLIAAPAEDGSAVTSTIVIALNLGRLDELFLTARGIPRPMDVTWSEIERLETLALLGHEIIHAYGLVSAAGDPTQGCRDPAAGEAPELSCVVVGENVIRREIGAPLDWGYGMSPLMDLPARYAELSRHRLALHSIGEVARSMLHTWSDESEVGGPEVQTP